MPFAEGTTTPPERSQAEILGILRAYGAADFGVGEAAGYAWVEFSWRGQRIRMAVKLPDSADRRWHKDRAGRPLKQAQAAKKAEAERWRRWRVLILRLKAKLEAVHDGDALLEEEFLAFFVLPGGGTVLEILGPKLQDMKALGLQLGRPALPPPGDVIEGEVVGGS